MAENIYSKGTRVWLVDKDQAWVSAEVTQVVKGADDSVTITFLDERGKASGLCVELAAQTCLTILLL